MSYDLQLYRRDFLRRALAENLGDWTSAPPIPHSARERLVAFAEAAGFARFPPDPEFAAYSEGQGHPLGDECTLDSPTVLAQLVVFSGEATFSIPYSDRANASIALCLDLARQVAKEHSLGFDDPQTGEVQINEDT